MLNRNEKIEIVEKVVKGKFFSKSPTSASLLRYLVNATLDGVDLKEATIGLEFLGEHYESEKSNARIRVNIYNLRKKLAQYYQTEGKEDNWRIEIAKGQYHPQFIKNSALKKQIDSKSYILASLSAIVILGVLHFISTLVFPLKPDLWKAFFNNNKNTTLYVGDVFGIMGTTATGNYGWNRDYSINSLDELYILTNSRPELKDKIAPANYHYITGMGTYASKALSILFYKYKRDFSIRFTSNSSISDIKEANSIYIGPIKNNNKFIELYNTASPYCEIVNDKIRIKNTTLGIDTSYVLSTEDTRYELAIVSRIPGPNETEQFLFFSDHDIGVNASIELFTNNDWLKDFSVEYLKDDIYFTAILRVKGMKRTSLEIETVLVMEH